MKNLLEHKWTANILSLATLVVAVVAWLHGNISKTEMANSGNNTFFIILLVIATLTIGSFILQIIRLKIIREQTEIEKLSVLQNSYLLNPNYVTSKTHGDESIEKDLGKGDTAEILTNSLKYDIFYSGEIATNIIKGAKYVYILPRTTMIFEELQNYISKISDSIILKTNSANALDVLTKKNLEFRFFPSSISCLYNFATFRQSTEIHQDYLRQDWWYVNPSNTKPDSHMLTFKISDNRDQIELATVFETLKQKSIKKNGNDVYSNRNKLHSFIEDK